MFTNGRLSLQEYGTISKIDTKREWCQDPKAQNSIWNRPQQLNKTSGVDIKAILTEDMSANEVKLRNNNSQPRKHRRTTSSPEKLVKAPGSEALIKEMLQNQSK